MPVTAVKVSLWFSGGNKSFMWRNINTTEGRVRELLQFVSIFVPFPVSRRGYI